MSQTIEIHEQQRQEWVAKVNQLVDQVETWCRNQGWTVHRDEKSIHEEELGDYVVPRLRADLGRHEISLNPIALHVLGARGRVDLEAFPALSRVKLLVDGDTWQIMTDSHVPLRQPWTEQTFVQLTRDMLG